MPQHFARRLLVFPCGFARSLIEPHAPAPEAANRRAGFPWNSCRHGRVRQATDWLSQPPVNRSAAVRAQPLPIGLFLIVRGGASRMERKQAKGGGMRAEVGAAAQARKWPPG